VVVKYIDDIRVQKLAERALWLGNDETHYLKVWTAHDVEDLKALIKLIVLWIDMDNQSSRYMSEMS